jgi:hypothetical protein
MCAAVLTRRNSLRFGVLEILRAPHKPMREVGYDHPARRFY